MSEVSLFPTALDDTNIYEVVARLSSTLSADITASTTTIPIASTTNFPTAGYIVIDNETIKYVSVSVGSVDATAGRGYAGTAASHTSGTQVLVAVTAVVFNKLRAGMIAAQTLLGISGSATTTTHTYKLSGVTGSGKAVNNAYAETIAGVKTFTDTPKMDVIAEKTAATGVTVDGILLKDDLDTSGIVDKTTAQTLSSKTLTKPVINGTNPTGAIYTPATGAQTVTLDCAANDRHFVTGHADGTAITFAISNITNNQAILISITQGAVVSTIAAWFATIKWDSSTTPVLTATVGKRDWFVIIRTGVDLYDGFVAGQNY